MAVAIKDPSQIFLNILGFSVEGFSKGSFVTVEQAEQNFSQRVSLKGKVKLFNNKNVPYKLEFTVDDSCSANTWLHALCKLQQKYGVAFPIPVFYKDNLGSSSFFCKAAYILEPKKVTSTTHETIAWTLICNGATNTIGGNVQDDALAKILAGLSTVIGVSGALGMDLSGIGSMAQAIATKAATGITGLFGG